jgi:hypothetical protein
VDVESGGRTLRLASANGRRDSYERTSVFTPSAAQLAEYAGVFMSDEAETTLTIAVEENELVARRRPDTKVTLTAVYKDAFRSPSGLVRFHRDASGRPTELSLVSGRVWDMRFRRQS